MITKEKAPTINVSAFRFCKIAYARSTLPERRHLEQTYTCVGEPLTIAFTLFTLGFQLLFVLLWEWDTLIPKVTPFPQTSHFAISVRTSFTCKFKLTDLSRQLKSNHMILEYYNISLRKMQALFTKNLKKCIFYQKWPKATVCTWNILADVV